MGRGSGMAVRVRWSAELESGGRRQKETRLEADAGTLHCVQRERERGDAELGKHRYSGAAAAHGSREQLHSLLGSRLSRQAEAVAAGTAVRSGALGILFPNPNMHASLLVFFVFVFLFLFVCRAEQPAPAKPVSIVWRMKRMICCFNSGKPHSKELKRSLGRDRGAHGGRRGGGAAESGGKGCGREEAWRGEARRIPAGRRRGGSRRGGARRSPTWRGSDGEGHGGVRRRRSWRRPAAWVAEGARWISVGRTFGGSRRGGERWIPAWRGAVEAADVGHGEGRRQVEQRALFGVRKMNQGGRKLKKVGHALL
ncbi:hypothetical protein GUJ93_ZPchr0009g1122 [Zizania palustris]|uniref:Uncharacterized protein n=1 Tax=Zizania palustris TaxID=103762 RepID=A0A8J5RPR5_ZIZPA|nr:hypothetical protein GUJ93_ZPchr0009g1122 [Zizania palustris]